MYSHLILCGSKLKNIYKKTQSYYFSIDYLYEINKSVWENFENDLGLYVEMISSVSACTNIYFKLFYSI